MVDLIEYHIAGQQHHIHKHAMEHVCLVHGRGVTVIFPLFRVVSPFAVIPSTYTWENEVVRVAVFYLSSAAISLSMVVVLISLIQTLNGTRTFWAEPHTSYFLTTSYSPYRVPIDICVN